MDRIEVFQILGIGETKDEKAIKDAYRAKLAVTNPEDDPEGFKRLRAAYDAACQYAKQGDEKPQERDTSPSGLWVERAAQIYANIVTRRDVACWEELFEDDCFISLEEEENCRLKLLRFLMEHFRLPTEVWKLLDKKLTLTGKRAGLREQFPADFVRYVESKCERGEDVEFEQFEGAPDAPYDLFLQYYDRCWQAVQEGNLEQAAQMVRDADELGIRHPIMEICRADLLVKQGDGDKGLELLESLRERYPGDAMISYNLAEMLWRQGKEAGTEDGERSRERAAAIFRELKAGNDNHYMANVRLTEWYYDNSQFQEAKKCAEKVLSSGGDDAFMELLGKVNQEIEKQLQAEYAESSGWAPALELCWCYLQDGKVSRGIGLALSIEKKLPPEKEAEYNGLLSKLYVEEAEYDTSIAMADIWEESLKRKLALGESEDEEKDRDRIRQAHLIRMQCYHNLGFKEKENFARAAKEGEELLTGTPKDIGVLLELAQIYIEMEEYERCLDISRRLVEDYQIYAAYAASLEAYRRQLDAGGVIRDGSMCIQYFPGYIKAYEYMAKVYLDLGYGEELEKLLSDAEKNNIKSVILDAYRFQMKNKPMEISVLNNKLKHFRSQFRSRVEKGELVFYENGLPVLTEYLYHYPDSYMLVERGIFHRAAHQYEAAREDFEKALILNPSNAYALNGLSFVYKYLGEYEKALICIKKAILYMDQDMSPVIYTDMAELYSLLGNHEMALAACRQYQELVKEPAVWFLEELAERHVELGNAKEACEIYGKCLGEGGGARYQKQVDACIRNRQEKAAREYLNAWKQELDAKAGTGLKRVKAMKTLKTLADDYCTFFASAGWIELVMGDREGALEQFKSSMKYYKEGSGLEGKIADAVFACIVCGDKKQGAKYAKVLKNWLRQEKFSPENKYFNREKGHLQLEFLAAYYEESEEALQAILDREAACGICHFCTHAVCREMEGVRILFLIRQGKMEEAKLRLCRNLEVQPADEYMLAIRHMHFE